MAQDNSERSKITLGDFQSSKVVMYADYGQQLAVLLIGLENETHRKLVPVKTTLGQIRTDDPSELQTICAILGSERDEGNY